MNWTPAPDELVQSADPYTALVFGRVWRFTQSGGSCWAAAQTIADELSISERTVRRKLDWLVAEGWLLSEERPGHPTIYRNSGRFVMGATPDRESDHPGQRVRPPRTESPTKKERKRQSKREERIKAPASAPPAPAAQGAARAESKWLPVYRALSHAQSATGDAWARKDGRPLNWVVRCLAVMAPYTTDVEESVSLIKAWESSREFRYSSKSTQRGGIDAALSRWLNSNAVTVLGSRAAAASKTLEEVVRADQPVGYGYTFKVPGAWTSVVVADELDPESLRRIEVLRRPIEDRGSEPYYCDPVGRAGEPQAWLDLVSACVIMSESAYRSALRLGHDPREVARISAEQLRRRQRQEVA